MNVVECPAELYPSLTHTSVFLGGGITGCPNWQQDMIDRLADIYCLTLVNPRRSSFDVADPTTTPFQIDWEYRHLRKVDVILFWFPCETLCPITLFELGAAAARGDRIIVGCHPEYARCIDVHHQLALDRPDVQVRTSLDGIELDIRRLLT